MTYRIGAGTVAAFGGTTREQCEVFPMSPGLNVDESTTNFTPDTYGSRVKYGVPPRALAHILGVGLQNRGILHNVVLTGMNSGTQKISVTVPSYAEALAHCSEEILSPIGWPWMTPWVVQPEVPTFEAKESSRVYLASLLKQVRLIKVVVGAGWLRKNAVIACKEIRDAISCA